MNRTKIGVTDIALEMFAEADDDGSGELSVIEIFCFLPELGFWSPNPKIAVDCPVFHVR